MNSWARSRKRIILAILFLFLVGMVGVPAYYIFYQAPTCFDGRQNGDETGPDCGGSCQLLCSTDSLPLISKGDPRVLSLGPNTYQVVALIENSNNDAEIYKAGYTFKLYDASKSAPIKVINGTTFVPKGGSFAIFEGPFTLEDEGVPTRATLEWKNDTIIWQKNTGTIPELTVKEITLSREATTPRIEVVIDNSTLVNVSNIDLVALVTDAQGNIFAASKTYIDSLASGVESRAVFTWPKPFGQEVVGVDIKIRIFPDRSFIR